MGNKWVHPEIKCLSRWLRLGGVRMCIEGDAATVQNSSWRASGWFPNPWIPASTGFQSSVGVSCNGTFLLLGPCRARPGSLRDLRRACLTYGSISTPGHSEHLVGQSGVSSIEVSHPSFSPLLVSASGCGLTLASCCGGCRHWCLC